LIPRYFALDQEIDRLARTAGAGDLWRLSHSFRHQLCSILCGGPPSPGHAVSIDDTTVTNRNAEEQIRARLRELTDQLREMRRQMTERPERHSANDVRGRRLPKPPRPPAPPKR
jgi:hypothetical protein